MDDTISQKQTQPGLLMISSTKLIRPLDMNFGQNIKTVGLQFATQRICHLAWTWHGLPTPPVLAEAISHPTGHTMDPRCRPGPVVMEGHPPLCTILSGAPTRTKGIDTQTKDVD